MARSLAHFILEGPYMPRVTIRLDADTHARLYARALAQEQTLSEIVRHALNQTPEAQPPATQTPQPHSLGACVRRVVQGMNEPGFPLGTLVCEAAECLDLPVLETLVGLVVEGLHSIEERFSAHPEASPPLRG
jgi:hypothetical protein